MTLEVRQLLIKSQLAGEPAAPAREAVAPEQVAQLKEEILAECKAWVADKLQELNER